MPKKIDSWNEILSPPAGTLLRIDAKLKECREKLQLQTTLYLPVVTVRYDLRGKTAGYAHGKNDIQLNLDLLNDSRYREDMINDTLPHEYAHCVVNANWKNEKSHGWEWQRIMGFLGVPATRCHNYEVKAARVHKQEFAYQCNCSEPHMVSALIHRRIQKGRIYTCNDCRGKVTLLNFIGKK